MEVVDYLRLARRRLWIIVMIPLLAAAGVLGFWQLSPQTYEATAYVFAPEALAGSGAQFSGPAGIASWVSEFSATAVSPRVVHRAARASGVPSVAITQGLKVTQVQQSGQLQISFAWTKRSMAERVVKQCAESTPKQLVAPLVAQARRALTGAHASLAAVTQNMLAASSTWGHTRPDLLYAQRLNVLVGLENARPTIKAGDISTRREADARISRVRAQVANLQQDVIQFQNLNARRQAATMVLARAQEGLQTARAQLVGARGSVSMLPTRPAQTSASLVKGLVSAVIAGLVIALCAIAGLELFRSSGDASRHPARPEDTNERARATGHDDDEENTDHQVGAPDHRQSSFRLVDAGAPDRDS